MNIGLLVVESMNIGFFIVVVLQSDWFGFWFKGHIDKQNCVHLPQNDGFPAMACLTQAHRSSPRDSGTAVGDGIRCEFHGTG